MTSRDKAVKFIQQKLVAGDFSPLIHALIEHEHEALIDAVEKTHFSLWRSKKHPYSLPLETIDQLLDIKEAYESNVTGKIEMIKEVRIISGCGLKEAKEMVEELLEEKGLE